MACGLHDDLSMAKTDVFFLFWALGLGDVTRTMGISQQSLLSMVCALWAQVGKLDATGTDRR